MAGSGGGCREKDQPKGRYLAWQPTSTPRKPAAVPTRTGGALGRPAWYGQSYTAWTL